MNLKTLSQFESVTSRLASNRTQNADKFTDHGLECLARVLNQTQVKEQKKLLLGAFDAFVNALSSQRSQPEPYIGIAFVLILIGNYPKALNYLKEARRLSPEHPDLTLLFDMIQKLQLKGKTNAGASRIAVVEVQNTENIDYDELYDQIEMTIVTEVRLMMQDNRSIPHPSCEERDLNNLRSKHDALWKLYSSIRDQLKVLEEEIDTSDLESHLKPFSVSLNRFEVALKISHDLIQLKSNIIEQTKQSQVLINEIKVSDDPNDLPVAEENLEVLLDDCDRFADQLDDADGKKYPVKPLLTLYAKMVAQLETLQDLLDEMKEKLGGKGE
jgi:hypothetical protein